VVIQMIDSMLSKCEKNDSFCIRCFGFCCTLAILYFGLFCALPVFNA